MRGVLEPFKGLTEAHLIIFRDNKILTYKEFMYVKDQLIPNEEGVKLSVNKMVVKHKKDRREILRVIDKAAEKIAAALKNEAKKSKR